MRPSGIYILPNLLTSINVLAGMFCIIIAGKGDNTSVLYASVALYFAMAADFLDGTFARLQKASSEFGIQYDSLSDMVSFGVAPAVLAYQLSLSGTSVGLGIAFLYSVCAALRLARYNTQATTGEKESFAGLPSPAAACFVASASVLLLRSDRAKEMMWPMGIAMLVISFLMISQVKYPSIADVKIWSRKPFRYLIVLVVIIGVFIMFIQRIEIPVFACFCAYVLLGPVRQAYRYFYPLPELAVARVRPVRKRLRRRRVRQFLGRFRRPRRK